VTAERESNTDGNADSPIPVAAQTGAEERSDQDECCQGIWK